MKITIQHHVDDPYLEVGFTDLKTNEEAEKLKQQILRDHEYGKDIHNGKMMLLLPSTFKEMAQNSMKWLNFQTDLEKLGMTKEMKLLIEKSFANEFKCHNQNQKLRELVESALKECKENAGGMEYGMALEKLLEESKK